MDNEMSFASIRRQRFLNEKHAREYAIDLLGNIEGALEDANDTSLPDRPRRSFSWWAASDSLKLFVLRYSAGDRIEDLQNMVPKVIKNFADYIPFDKPKENEAYTLDITQQEAYVYLLWLLAFCQLLGRADLTPVALKWLDINRGVNRGMDGLFELIAGKLADDEVPTGKVLLYPEAYRPLAMATLPNAADRPALVAEFLKGWYKSMKSCYWHGTHTDKEGSSYFGYWSFEAALVTYLWDIDDSSYRDHLVYPKDMVDFARANFPYKGPFRPVRLRCEAGQPCPREGWWFTPANDKSRRRFSVGEVMPDFQSDYGLTIWQWDPSQA